MTNLSPDIITAPEPEFRHARKMAIGSVVSLFVAAIALLLTLPTPYLIHRPGPAFNTLGNNNGQPIIQVTGAPSYPTTGALNLLTVNEQGVPGNTPNWIEIFQAWVDPTQSVLPVDVVYPPDQPSSQVDEQNQQLMAASKSSATTVVLKALNLPDSVQVDYRLDNVAGPSAGMMFALALYDKLTPGELTGGHMISGTGTIDDQGNIGRIGGIQMKLFSAKAAKSDWFLAPASNCGEVVGHVPDGIRVVSVNTFLDALNAVNIIASNADTESLSTCK